MTCRGCIHDGYCWEQKEIMTPPECDEEQTCCVDKSRYIELPCKVGDKVYVLSQKSIQEYIVHAIECDESTITIKCHNWFAECEGLLHKHIAYFYKTDFGKTVFITREEAKKALAERKENEH